MTGRLGEEIRNAVEAPPTRIAVVGGGIAGLVVARECARPGFEVTLLEAGERLGGSVAALEIDGITVDAGAESFATRGGHVADLLGQLGLDADIVEPNPAGAWVRNGARTVPLPKAGLLGIPSSPLAADVVAAIGWSGALRAYLDRLLPVLTIGTERRLGALVRKRMGAKVHDRLVAPVVTGVYSAAADDLDVAVIAPGLNTALTRLGSLSGAVSELRSAAPAGSAVQGIRGGMWRLPAALAADIQARGGALRTGAEVVAIESWHDSEQRAPRAEAEPVPGGVSTAAPADDATEADAAGGAEAVVTAGDGGADAATAAEAPAAAVERPARWLLRLADGSTLDADVVVVAAPAETALALLPAAAPELAGLSGLDWPPASSVELVTLVLASERLAEAPRGTGVLVADGGGTGVTAKALTHSTAKWPWLAEAAGPGRHVVRLSYGRAGRAAETRDLDDRSVRDLAVADAAKLLSIPLTASDVVACARTPWTNALPYATVGQRERIQRVRDEVGSVEGLEVTGSWLSGTGLASVIPESRAVAERVRGLRWKALTDRVEG